MDKNEDNGIYKITAFSIWESPKVFFVDTKKEKDEIVAELKNQQYKVEIEEDYQSSPEDFE